MRTARIESSQSPSIFDRLATRWPVRYGIAFFAAAISVTLEILFRQRPGEVYFLWFVTVLTSSVLGGLGPGLLATFLAVVIGSEVPLGQMSPTEVQRLLIEGTLVSVGGMLRTALLNSHERHKAEVKLEREILEASDDERRRIGNDLHDGLGQQLSGIALLSETIAQQLSAGQKPEVEKVETITQLVSEAVRITRDLAKNLSPITLERDGLVNAVAELAETTSSLYRIRCNWEYDQQDVELDRARSLHVFRILQEAVNNAIRHGKAKNVHIELTSDGRNLTATVVDDGIGLSEKTMANPGFGLRIMEHRARMLRATLSVERVSQKGGTLVTCVCPLDGQPGVD